MEGEVRIGIVGLGYAGTEHLRSFNAHPRARVVAVCEIDEALARLKTRELGIDCAVHSDVDGLLAEPGLDAVVVATPNHLHVEQAVAAARAGKAILLEKPPALTPDDLAVLCNEIDRAGVVCEVDMLLRWHPMCKAVFDAIRNGAVGDVFSVETEILIGELEMPEPDWERRRATGGDLHLAVGCHVLDQALWLMGSEVAEATAMSTKRNPEWEFDTFATTMLRFEGGSVGRVTASVESKIPYELNIRVFGTHGSILNNRLCVPHDGEAHFELLASEDRVDAEALPFDRSAEMFVRALSDPTASAAPLAEVRRTFEVAFEAAAPSQVPGRGVGAARSSRR